MPTSVLASYLPPLLPFAAKALIVGAVVYGLLWVAGRFGARLAGAMNGMPLISGPALFLAYSSGGEAVAVRYSEYGILGGAVGAAFMVVYAVASHYTRPAWSLVAGLAVASTLALALQGVPVDPFIALAASLAALALGYAAIPPQPLPSARSVQMPRGQAALFACAIILALDLLTPVLGAAAIGIIAAAPTTAIVSLVLCHRLLGAPSARAFAASWNAGKAAGCMFSFVAAVGIPLAGFWTGFAAAIVAGAAVGAIGARLSRSTEAVCREGVSDWPAVGDVVLTEIGGARRLALVLALADDDGRMRAICAPVGRSLIEGERGRLPIMADRKGRWFADLTQRVVLDEGHDRWWRVSVLSYKERSLVVSTIGRMLDRRSSMLAARRAAAPSTALPA